MSVEELRDRYSGRDLMTELRWGVKTDHHGYTNKQDGEFLNWLCDAAEREIVHLNDVISALDRNPKRFITCYKETEVSTKYDAGIVVEDGGNFLVGYEMQGARDTFSIGQPVYDKDGNLMGYLGIGVFDHLDYATDGNIRIPVEHWTICLPTKHCEGGKKVFTYWQNKEKGADDVQGNSN